MIENKYLINKAMKQAKETGGKKQQSKQIWFTRKIKYVIQESEKKTAKIQKNSDILLKRNRTCEPVTLTKDSQRDSEDEVHGK